MNDVASIDPVLYGPDGKAGRPLGDLVMTVKDEAGNVLDPFSAGVFENLAVARRIAGKYAKPEGGGVAIGENLVVNLGRQTIANLLGNRDVFSGSASPWVVTKVSWGRYDEAPRFTDSSLSPQPTDVTAGGGNMIAYNGTDFLKPISRVDYPQSFIVRFECNLASSEANAQTIREMGLWTSNGTLFARKAMVGVVKRPGQSLSFLWSIRT
jgi:hypothetical protein